MDRLVEQLSTYASEMRYDELPEQVTHQAKRLLVDALGCAIGGFEGEPSRLARGLAGTVSSSRPATVLVSGQSTSPDMAAFANGVMVRYLDYNDGYSGRENGHPSGTIAAVLSSAEVARANGETTITATVLAYEAFCRLCDAVSVVRTGFDHITLGIIAAGLGAAKALGLSHQQTAQTVNLCVAPNAALNQARMGTASMWRACAFANASRNAVFAALLAQEGLTGPEPIFEGPGGFFAAVTREPFSLEPLGGGGQYKIMEVSTKRFPFGLYGQTVVQAALDIRDRLPANDGIARINVETLQTAIDHMAEDEEKWRPASQETAEHSMPYIVAVALTHGTVQQRHFSDEFVTNADLLDLTKRVVVSPWDEANRRAPEAMLSRVEVVTELGERLRSPEVPYHRGHWKSPMEDGELEEKFRTLSRNVLSPAQTDAVLERLWNLEQVEDVGEVIRAVKAEGGQP